MSDQKMPQGILISGICKGARTEMFNNNPQHYVGFDVETLDQYGQKQTILEEVAVFGERAEEIINKANASKGKHCVISVIKRANKSPRTGNAYMRTMINRESQVLVIS